MKLAKLALLLACLPAAADLGPFYIKIGTSCDQAKIYLNGSILYGSEVGCSALAGSPYVGTFDAVSGQAYLSVAFTSSTTGRRFVGMYQVNTFTGIALAYLSDGTSSGYIGAIPTKVSLTPF